MNFEILHVVCKALDFSSQLPRQLRPVCSGAMSMGERTVRQNLKYPPMSRVPSAHLGYTGRLASFQTLPWGRVLLFKRPLTHNLQRNQLKYDGNATETNGWGWEFFWFFPETTFIGILLFSIERVMNALLGLWLTGFLPVSWVHLFLHIGGNSMQVLCCAWISYCDIMCAIH